MDHRRRRLRERQSRGHRVDQETSRTRGRGVAHPLRRTPSPRRGGSPSAQGATPGARLNPLSVTVASAVRSTPSIRRTADEGSTPDSASLHDALIVTSPDDRIAPFARGESAEHGRGRVEDLEGGWSLSRPT